MGNPEFKKFIDMLTYFEHIKEILAWLCRFKYPNVAYEMKT